MSDASERTADPTPPASAPLPQSLPPPPRGSFYDTPAKPLQVLLRFQQQGKRVGIEWRCDLFGTRTTPFKTPYDAATLPLVAKALGALQVPTYPQVRGSEPDEGERAVLAPLGLWADGRVPAEAHRTVGLALYKALGHDGMATLEEVRNYAISQGVSVNYALHFPRAAQALVRLPWELLANDDGLILFRGGRDLDSCERYLEGDRAIRPPASGGSTLHLLAVVPGYGLSEQARADEQAARRKSWDRLRDAGKVTYDELSPATSRALGEYMRNAQRLPDIVHFFGQGTDDAGGSLYFDDGAGGFEKKSPAQLAALLGETRLLVILGCRSSVFASALSDVVDASVMTQFVTGIPMATRFTEVFYDELLAKCRTLQESVAEVRQSLFVENEYADWYAPSLYIRLAEPRPVYLVAD